MLYLIRLKFSINSALGNHARVLNYTKAWEQLLRHFHLTMQIKEGGHASLSPHTVLMWNKEYCLQVNVLSCILRWLLRVLRKFYTAGLVCRRNTSIADKKLTILMVIFLDRLRMVRFCSINCSVKFIYFFNKRFAIRLVIHWTSLRKSYR